MIEAVQAETERAALRACAVLCWQRREELNLSASAIEAALVACTAVGTDDEASAAAEVLAARRAADRKQAKFDQLLLGTEAPKSAPERA